MSGEKLEWICKLKDIRDRTSTKFTFKQGDLDLEGFCIRLGDQVHAYLNECAHLPMSMDWDDNEFFTEDGKRLLCKTHGAVYVPETGLCVDGPCPGRTLTRIPVKVEKGSVWRIKQRIPRP